MSAPPSPNAVPGRRAVPGHQAGAAGFATDTAYARPAVGTGRQIAVWAHTARPQAIAEASRLIDAVAAHGIECLVQPDLRPVLATMVAPGAQLGDITAGSSPEVVVVFGGDGTILRAAQWALEADIPLVGVNLGHVGFLAELEMSQFDQLVRHVVNHDYVLERRLTLAVEVHQADGSKWTSFAVNEVSLEKNSRQLMIEVIASIDSLPVSRWACDGVLVATPTGSTAYAFSAGGPVAWPNLAAFLLVPISAHALFNRPLVLAPESEVSLELMSDTPAVLWCDGNRTIEVAPGSSIQVRRGEHELTMARLSIQPFTSRLVKKFALPIQGWRNPTQAEGSAPTQAEGRADQELASAARNTPGDEG